MVPVFTGQTANEAWQAAADRFRGGQVHVQRSRAGVTHEVLHAVFAISDSRQRWAVSRFPAMNPAFAIAEVIWMLQGRMDAAFPNHWNPRLPEYAGYTPEYAGAYGQRLRNAFGLDQLERATDALAASADSRQVVLQIWNAPQDLPKPDGTPTSGDIPCNICSLLKVRDARLEWTQILRSNDLMLGVPHNIVQFTSLQEVMAGWLGLVPGQYTQISDSLHVYTRDLPNIRISEPIDPEVNNDSLSLPRTESAAVLASIRARVDPMIAPTLRRSELAALATQRDVPRAYENLVLMLAADTARRRKWPDIVERAVADCTNPALRQLWLRWASRMEGLANDGTA